MSSPSQPSDPWNRNGVPIRRRDDGFINVSDLWKAEGQLPPLRPDKWAKRDQNQHLLDAATQEFEKPVWLVVRGGNALQGTFASPDIALKYAEDLSLDCYEWLSGLLGSEAKNTGKARERTIPLGSIFLWVFQLPSGRYRLSQTQVAEAIGKPESSFREFLASKSPEALPYKGFHSGKLSVEGRNMPINPIPVTLAIAYWTKESLAGNLSAIRLLASSANEAIERRADAAFGVRRSEEEYNHRFKNVFEKLADFFPDSASITKVTDPYSGAGSMILAEQKLLRRLKRKFPQEMFAFKKSEFVRDLVLLGAETDDWHLTYERGLAYPDGAANRNAYPDLISQPSECLVDGKKQKVVLLFQCVDTIVDENHVKDCFYMRQYIDLVKEHLKVDHALLFLVSPYGVTRYAAACIKESDELRGCVGVITLKQLATFLFEKAAENKRDNIRLGKLKAKFIHLMSYRLLDELLSEEELSKFSVETEGVQLTQLDLF